MDGQTTAAQLDNKHNIIMSLLPTVGRGEDTKTGQKTTTRPTLQAANR